MNPVGKTAFTLTCVPVFGVMTLPSGLFGSYHDFVSSKAETAGRLGTGESTLFTWMFGMPVVAFSPKVES